MKMKVKWVEVEMGVEGEVVAVVAVEVVVVDEGKAVWW